jgi:hypothetical protein
MTNTNIFIKMQELLIKLPITNTLSCSRTKLCTKSYGAALVKPLIGIVAAFAKD